jgi:hypothetical protein
VCTERLPIPVLILNAGALVLISLNNQQMSVSAQEALVQMPYRDQKAEWLRHRAGFEAASTGPTWTKMTQERDELEIHEELLEEDDDRRSSSSSDCFPFEFSDLDDEVCSCGTSSSQGVEIRTP